MKVLIVISARDEEKIIEDNVSKLIDFMKKQKDYSWHLIVSEDSSRDNTPAILKKLAQRYPKKQFSFISNKKGSKSESVKRGWYSQKADIYMYMDADLSTDISHIPELIQGIKQGYDIVVGSRGLKNSNVERSMKRNFISYAYNILTRLFFSLNVKDLQCGFKAISQRTLDEIVKKTKYIEQGFMDTEMLILASQKKFKIKEIPVKWQDYRKSKFNFLFVAIRFINNLLKVKRDLILKHYD